MNERTQPKVPRLPRVQKINLICQGTSKESAQVCLWLAVNQTSIIEHLQCSNKQSLLPCSFSDVCSSFQKVSQVESVFMCTVKLQKASIIHAGEKIIPILLNEWKENKFVDIFSPKRKEKEPFSFLLTSKLFSKSEKAAENKKKPLEGIFNRLSKNLIILENLQQKLELKERKRETRAIFCFMF